MVVIEDRGHLDDLRPHAVANRMGIGAGKGATDDTEVEFVYRPCNHQRGLRVRSLSNELENYKLTNGWR